MARICVVRQFYFPLDMHTRREVEALLAAGHEVDVVCITRAGEPRFEQQGRLTIRRLPLQHRRGGIATYLAQYLAFFMLATATVAALHLRRRYDLVQVNSLPDPLVFSALVPKLLGARVLLDLLECMPEFFATKFKTDLRHPGVRAISWMEQASIRFADFAMTCTEQMREAFVSRGAPRGKIGVIMISSDESIFDATRFPPTGRRPGQFRLISHGCIEERYGLDTVIRAVALLKDDIPGLQLDIYGEGAYRDELRRLAEELGVTEHVYFSPGFVPIDDLLRAISSADAGVVAMKRDVFRDITHTNKMYDFITMGIPAIVSRTRSVQAYFPDSCFQYFTADDKHDLARAIRELADDPALGGRLVREARRVNEPYRWHHQRRKYLDYAESLIDGRKPVVQPTPPPEYAGLARPLEKVK